MLAFGDAPSDRPLFAVATIPCLVLTGAYPAELFPVGIIRIDPSSSAQAVVDLIERAEAVIGDLSGAQVASRHVMGERVVIGSDGHFASADREQVHRDGTWHWCVHLLATNGTCVYLQRRALHLARNPDRWESTAAGHITAEDATDQQPITANQHAAQVALMHEVREELRVTWDVHRAHYLGEVSATGIGGGETCNCRTMVFRLEVGDAIFTPTPEVAEVRSFEIEEVAQALREGRGLPAADGRERQFANNFAPVFERFASPESGREPDNRPGA